MVTMTQRGAWWKGLTEKGVEVVISAGFFIGILAKQQKTNYERPYTVKEARKAYDIDPACLSPQWWVDAFLDHDYAVGMQNHTWTRKKGYARLQFHGDSRPHFDGPEATLIFRTLSEKQAQRNQASHSLKAAQYAVDDFFNKRTTSVVW